MNFELNQMSLNSKTELRASKSWVKFRKSRKNKTELYLCSSCRYLSGNTSRWSMSMLDSTVLPNSRGTKCWHHIGLDMRSLQHVMKLTRKWRENDKEIVDVREMTWPTPFRLSLSMSEITMKNMAEMFQYNEMTLVLESMLYGAVVFSLVSRSLYDWVNITGMS